MFFINANSYWSSAILKHLLLNPELADSLHFRPEYFSVPIHVNVGSAVREHGKRCEEFYSALSQFITKHNAPYNTKTFEHAYFEFVDPGNLAAYCSPQSMDSDVQKAISEKCTLISSFFNMIEDAYQSLSKDFIEEKATELVVQMSQYLKVFKLEETLQYILLSDDNIDTTEYEERMTTAFEKNESDYALPDGGISMYTSFEDARLRVKVDDKLYTSRILPLNTYLSGGFKRQTVTGFLTKTGGGKSTLLFTLAADALLNGYNVAFFNLEMNDYEAHTNIMSALTDVRSYKDMLLNLTDDEMMGEVYESINELNIGKYALIGRTSTCRTDIKWIKRMIERAEKRIRKSSGNEEFRFDMIFVDYLYLLDPTKKMMRNARSDEAYRQLAIEFHEFCQDDDYCGITVFQGNRGAESKMSNSESLTLADVGDSYAAFRDIEYVFSIARYVKEDGSDGVLICPLKTRHYDGNYDNAIFCPYNFSQRKYDSPDAEIITIESDEEQKTGRKRKNKVTIGDVLDADIDLHLEVPGGYISSACIKNGKVSCASYSYLKAEYEKRGWIIKTVKDFDNFDNEKAKVRINSAIQKALENAEAYKQPKVGIQSSVINDYSMFDL